MRVTVCDEEYTPSPQEMAEEFWESNSELIQEVFKDTDVEILVCIRE